jgi:hypothetical protein
MEKKPIKKSAAIRTTIMMAMEGVKLAYGNWVFGGLALEFGCGCAVAGERRRWSRSER